MQIITSPKIMQKTALAWRRKGEKIGFVSTMGALHEGHLSLVKLARQEADRIVLSIFVNPLQFGPHEDFDRYPRNLEGDRQLCRANGVDVIFHPSAKDMYPGKSELFVDENDLAKQLCGKFRPGHFRGVLTVVAKLFNIVLPDVAVFGQKDAQQAILIRRMVEVLNFPVKLVIAPIIRAADGLAMSSRNKYLSDDERKQALCLSEALRTARYLYRTGERDGTALKKTMRAVIKRAKPDKIDYIEIVAGQDLKPIARITKENCLIALAVWIGKTRLIDNLPLPDDRLGNLGEE
jgi:pantoate--beta-alanine ligase